VTLIPSSLQMVVWSVLALVGLLAALWPPAGTFWMIPAGIGIGLTLADGVLCWRRPRVELTRNVHHNLPVTAFSEVVLQLKSRASHPLILEVHDCCDAALRVKDQPQSLVLPAGQTATLRYKVFPTRRGAYAFHGAHIFVHSRLRLWQKKWFLPCEDQVKVFPNFKEVGHFTLRATHHQLSLLGIKKLARRGEGKEFHQLRDYHQGDSLRQIDWKATSRFRRLISKEYQDERDQQIIFVLDSGRRMRHRDGGRSHLDQALNSILLLAYVAIRQGDGVGLYSFGGTEKWLPPCKQENSLRSLLLGMYDIESSPRAADYLRAAQDLQRLQSRRSLMVIVTNSRLDDHENLSQMARQLSRKHLVAIADLRESILDEVLPKPITGLAEALRYQMLLHNLVQRKKLRRQLNHVGITTLDVTAAQLPAALVNCYLEVKSAGRL